MKKMWKKLFLCVAVFTLTTLTFTHWSANFLNERRPHEDEYTRIVETGDEPRAAELVQRVTSEVKRRVATEVQQLTRQLAVLNKNDYVEDNEFSPPPDAANARRNLDVRHDFLLNRDEPPTERDSAVRAERIQPERDNIRTQDQRVDASELREKHVDTPVIDDQLTSSAQQRRQQHVVDACSVLGANELTYQPDWVEMYVDDRKQYIYCLVSKASCTSWKQTLLLLTGEVDRVKYQRPEQLPVVFVHNHDISDRYIKRFVHYKQKNESDYRLKKYFKFLFVREPFERLVSAYRDKILKDPAYHVRDEIVRRYRPSATTAARSNAARSTGAMPTDDAVSSTQPPLVQPTFTEFVRYVLDQRAAGKVLDRHWIPQNELCRPCRIKYDFVGHQETLQSDAATILRRLKAVGRQHKSNYTFEDVQFPADHVSAHSVDYVQRLFAELPAKYVDGLMQLYAVDFAMFDFKPSFIVVKKKSVLENVHQKTQNENVS